MEDNLTQIISLSSLVSAPQPLGSFIRGTQKEFSITITTARKTMADDPQDQAELEGIFRKFDADGDGKISSEELGKALKSLGKVTADEVNDMMAEIDTDGDGFISLQEFKAFAQKDRGLMKDVAKIF